MSQKNELVPKRRFKEFENAGDWEQRKLGDVAAHFEYGLNVSATDYDGVNKYLRITDIDENSHLLIKEDLTSPNVDLKNADNYLLEEDDILFARTGASVGKTYQYRKIDGKVYYAGFLIRAKVKPDFDSSFIFQNTLTNQYDNFIRVTSQRSGQPGVNAKEYASYTFHIPKKDEQEKIGNLFRVLDDTITLHQRKLDKLKSLKQGYLYQMFPQNGQKVPTLRFSGFSGDWGVHKLKDMASLMNGYAFKSENYVSSGIYKILTISNVTGQRYTDMNETNSVDYLPSNIQSYQILQQGDVLISLTGNVGRVSIVNEENCLLNQRVGLLKINSNVNQEYIYQCLNNKKFEEKMIKSGQGAAQLNISKNDIEEYEILLPSKKEQQKIGQFFKQLDETIDIQEQELEKLKNLKEAYLNEMFV
ncbi:restriction endonuclease subunit S [Aerococcus viridans]